MTEETKEPLIGKTLEELRTLARDLGMPAFVGGQIARWLYVQHVKDINEMANISKKHRELLAQRFTVGCHAPIDAQYSKDGTIKYLFPVYAGASKEKLRHEFVETVYIPDGDRATLCVSSQVGCKMNCLFCQTGKQGFEGSLTAADILNQVYALPDVDKLTNIVFMGQGEPMDNLNNVLRATEILTADYGWAWSPKRITVSSVGVRKKLRRFLDESDCHVAISLHSPIPEQRAQLMPAERGMGIEEVVKLLREYDFTHQRRLSFEYILFGGLNDTPTHARHRPSVGRTGVSRESDTLPPNPRRAPSRVGRGADGGLPRLPDPPRRLHDDPCVARPGHLRGLRTPFDEQGDRRGEREAAPRCVVSSSPGS